MRDTNRSLAVIGVLGLGLAAISSFWLARLLSEPIGALSNSLAQMAASHNMAARLPVTGSSRELDTLTHTFNALMASASSSSQYLLP